MVSAEFDVYFSGQCLPGFAPEDVVTGIAKTFKLSDEAASRLMDGRPHRIKAACDKATTLRYREAMAKIGAKVDIVRAGDTPNEPTPAEEKSRRDIRALVDGPAEFTSQAPRTPHDPAAGPRDDSGDSIPWEPPVKTAAKAEPTPELSVAPVGSMLGEDVEQEPYKLVTVPDLGVAEAGEIIPTLPDKRQPVTPEISHLHIEPLADD